jgi:hypothetical protein
MVKNAIGAKIKKKERMRGKDLRRECEKFIFGVRGGG